MEKKQQLLKVVPWLISKVLLKLHDKQRDLRGRQKQNFFRGYSSRELTQGTCYQFMITQKLLSLTEAGDFFICIGKSDFLFNLHMQVCKCSMFANWPELHKVLSIQCAKSIYKQLLFLKPKQKLSPLESQAQMLSKSKVNFSLYVLSA